MRTLTALVCLLAYICVGASDELNIDSQQLAITLALGSDLIWNIPAKYPTQQKVQISPFFNEKTNTTSFPCSVDVAAPSLFHRRGKISHQRSTFIGSDFWKGGQIWDVIHSGNTIVCVFQRGEVSHFKTRGFETTYKPFSKDSTSQPFLNNTIAYGRLLEYRQSEDTLHILYLSESGCFLINKDNSWTQLSGFNGARLGEAKILKNQVYMVFESNITLYSIDISQMLLTRVAEYTVYFRENGQDYPLAISNFQIDPQNKKIYLVDSYEGIKYCELGSASKVEAKALLPSENCQQIIFIDDLVLMSCSHLVIANTTNLRLLRQVRYPFRIRHLIYRPGYLTAFGHQYYTIYSMVFNSGQGLSVEELVTGKLPDGEYSHILYLSSMKYFLLFSKESMEYGVIAPAQYQLHCAFSKIASNIQEAHLKGQNFGTLKVSGHCQQLNQSLGKECTSLLPIKVNIYDLIDYKAKLEVFVILLILSLAAWGGYRLCRLRRERNSLRYAQLSEQVVYRQQNTEAVQSASDGEGTKVSQVVEIIE